MKPELVSLQRRPFLTPIWLTAGFAFLGFCFCVCALWFWATASSTIVVVVRHAEKDLSISAADPPLTAAGVSRANLLANMFGGSGGAGSSGGAGRLGHIDAIYVSPTLRSKETGRPLAERLGIGETVVSPDDPKALAHRVLRDHHGGRVLIVGHSDTIPTLVKELSGNADIPDIGDQEYGTLYIVTVPRIGHANLLRLSY
jgi:broad specificity phosphatase PhoE